MTKKVQTCFLIISAFALFSFSCSQQKAPESEFIKIQNTISVIDSEGDVGRYSSLGLDSLGSVHISYMDNSSGQRKLKYATNSTGNWIVETVDETDDVGSYTSLAIDSNNKVHISYYDSTNSNLKYATNSTGNWICSTIDSAEYVGRDSSIAVDSEDKVHISYLDFTNFNRLKYATNSTGSWEDETIDTINNVWDYTSLAIDSSDDIYIAYLLHDVNNPLQYATNSTGSWEIETIDTNAGDGKISLKIDQLDNIHISYFKWANNSLRYAMKTNEGWLYESIEFHYPDFYYDVQSSLFLDDTNAAHIAYYYSISMSEDLWGDSAFELRYASNTSGVWQRAVLDSDGVVGLDQSIAVDNTGSTHISYYDSDNKVLKYTSWQ
jgi:hypothetical protein